MSKQGACVGEIDWGVILKKPEVTTRNGGLFDVAFVASLSYDDSAYWLKGVYRTRARQLFKRHFMITSS